MSQFEKEGCVIESRVSTIEDVTTHHDPLLTLAFESVFGLGLLDQFGEVGQRQRGAGLQVDALHPSDFEEPRMDGAVSGYPWVQLGRRVSWNLNLRKSIFARGSIS